MRRFIVLAASLAITAALAFAQAVPVVTNNTEYDIGLDCPVAQALSPDGAVLWVLMQGCFSRKYTLQSYNVADGSLRQMVSDFSDDLEPLRAGYVDGRTNPLLVGPDELLSIHFIENETYSPRSLLIALDGEAAPTPVLSDDELTELLYSFTDYPETAIYSHDHRRAAVVGATGLYVFDLASGDELFSLPIEEESYNAYPSFSTDGQTLYVTSLDDYEDFSNYASTLSVYSLPDGELRDSFAVPSFLVWVSPDGKYAAAETGSNDGEQSELFVVDLASGAVSEAFSLYEPERRLMACANDGRDMSDVDFMVSGHLFLTSVSWLPDSSGFVFTRSYGGEAAGGGSPCAFNTSRLNHFEINQ